MRQEGCLFWQFHEVNAFVGWLSGQKDCFNAGEFCAVVGEQGPIVAHDDGQR
jgi:hypothetical protein